MAPALPYTPLSSEPEPERHPAHEEETYDVGPDDYDHAIHLASVAEKKRLWWRNVFINALFVASWCVNLATLLNLLSILAR
jgi:solute carrier family 35 protein C2